MANQSLATDAVGLSVAGLELSLDAQGTGIQMALPECHSEFKLAEPKGSGLLVQVREGTLQRAGGWRPLYSPSETWELWRDAAGRFVFLASPHSPPPRQLTVDAGFGVGELFGDFAASTVASQPVYPLSDLDAKLYANWLGESGDLILHAAGVAAGGRGYCFAGGSGTGKSTLATAFAGLGSATVLGEDNVVLRYLDGRFWVFGTPWHLDPARCSPLGVPLEVLFFLDRASSDGARPCTPDGGIARLLQSAFVPYYRPELVVRILERLALLARCVPFRILGHRLGSDVRNLL